MEKKSEGVNWQLRAIVDVFSVKGGQTQEDDTCCYAVKRVWQQVIDLLPLVNRWAAAVDLIQSGISVVHPLHQPLELAVTHQVVASQIPASRHESRQRQTM